MGRKPHGLAEMLHKRSIKVDALDGETSLRLPSGDCRCAYQAFRVRTTAELIRGKRILEMNAVFPDFRTPALIYRGKTPGSAARPLS
jgi:hypothetical protein